MPGPYLSKSAAAELCGYSSRYFSEIVEKYQIRRYGPALNKFREEDLHKFMENPTCFLTPIKTTKYAPNQPKPRSFTPVQI